MNVLFTSVGRRSYLINYFREVLMGLGEIHVANSTENTTAMLAGDKSVVTPLIYDERYIPFLIEYCLKHKIDAIIPLFDIDLPILSKNRMNFEEIGVTIIVSIEEVITICNDKWESYMFLKRNGFKTPFTSLSVVETVNAIHSGKISFPLILKPRWGMGSISVYEVDCLEELTIFYNKIKNSIPFTYLVYESHDIENSIIIQEKLDGQEYGLDIINDLKGNYQNTIMKKKLAMRSGETDSAETIYNFDLKTIGERLGKILRHHGNLDVDVFIVNDKPFVLEMNARFGGGYPFSHIAGVNLPKAILQWLNNKPVVESLLTPRIGVVGHKSLSVIEGVSELKSKVSRTTDYGGK